MSNTPVVDVLQQVLENCPGVPIMTATSAYIRAARRFCNQTRWLQTPLLGATVAPVSGVGTPTYNLGSDAYSEVFGISGVSIKKEVGDWRPLTSGNATDWDVDDDNDLPQEYQYIPHGQIMLHPTPDAAYDLTVSLVVQPKIGSNAIDARLLVNWSEALEHGTLAYLLMLPKQAWTDRQRGAIEEGLFRAAIATARSDVQAGYNAGAASTGLVGRPNSAVVRTKMQAI